MQRLEARLCPFSFLTPSSGQLAPHTSPLQFFSIEGASIVALGQGVSSSLQAGRNEACTRPANWLMAPCVLVNSKHKPFKNFLFCCWQVEKVDAFIRLIWKMVHDPSLLCNTQECIPLSKRMISHDLTPSRQFQTKYFVMNDLVLQLHKSRNGIKSLGCPI